jgi:hypothetical protein
MRPDPLPAKIAARRLAEADVPDTDAAATMCRLLLMELCRLDGSACEAWSFCDQYGCPDGPNVQGPAPPVGRWVEPPIAPEPRDPDVTRPAPRRHEYPMGGIATTNTPASDR